MKISIVTATFNSAETIESTLCSVVKQLNSDSEYIIVDGASIDGTQDILKQYADQDKRIKWISEPDEGIADAFNKGVVMASGEWVGFIGSDDCYVPGAFETVMDIASEDPDVAVIHGDLIRLDEMGNPLFVVKPSDIDKTIWHQMPVNHPATFVRRQLFEDVGLFDKSLKVAMDYDLILRIYKAGKKFVYVEQSITMMSYGGASDSRFLDGLKEVRQVKVREGCPRWKADYWLVHRFFLEVTKKFLRSTGLHGLLKLHPRFRNVGSGQ